MRKGTTYQLRALLRQDLAEVERRREAIFAAIRGLDALCEHPDRTPTGSGWMDRCDECQELVPIDR